jgi:peroxiredoxin (alkyl hydroperoxide reductase subunit C)
VSIFAPGTPAPDFQLITERGKPFTQEDLRGQTSVLVFFPNAFSPVCTDQFSVYQEVLADFEERGAKLYGISCDSSWTLKAFREKLGVDIPMLSDYEPKGEVSRAFGAYHEAGFSDRAIVIVDPEGVVTWSHVADNPGELPGANLIFDGLRGSDPEGSGRRGSDPEGSGRQP